MASRLTAIAPVLVGVTLAQVGLGIMTTLIPILLLRAGVETQTIGYVASCYFVGFLVGALVCARIVARVGHIRAFAVFAATAADAALLMSLVNSVWLWAGLRFVIGFVVLVGLAAKNAILIVEFAKQAEEAGHDRFESAIQAARTRLRPILMTSFAFILGVVPLVIATGAGAEMRQSLGTAVFFGMLGVTGFGLIFTPVFYVVVRGLASRRRPAPAHPAESPAE